MEVLAYQIGYAHLSLERKKGSRHLASINEVPQEGRLGKDIWGSAFIYRIKENKIFLLSLGPNKKKDTKSLKLKLSMTIYLFPTL